MTPARRSASLLSPQCPHLQHGHFPFNPVTFFSYYFWWCISDGCDFALQRLICNKLPLFFPCQLLFKLHLKAQWMCPKFSILLSYLLTEICTLQISVKCIYSVTKFWYFTFWLNLFVILRLSRKHARYIKLQWIYDNQYSSSSLVAVWLPLFFKLN